MAESELATSLFQLASAGIALSKNLHHVGAAVREAGEQTDTLAKNISEHCRALKSLGRQIRSDDPSHSTEALEVARSLESQSKTVLAEIKRLLPNPQRTNDKLSFKQRLQWSFRKSRVSFLVGQLELLKSTTTLLHHILSSVPNMRKYRRSRERSPELLEELNDEIAEAQNLLYERCQAQQVLSELAAEDRADEVLSIAPPDVRSSSPSPPYSLVDIAPHPGNFLAEIDSYAKEISPADSRALTLQKTTHWLSVLYGRWTTLDDQCNVAEDAQSCGEEIVSLVESAATDDSIESQVSQQRPAEIKKVSPTANTPNHYDPGERATRSKWKREISFAGSPTTFRGDNSRRTRKNEFPPPRGILMPPRIKPFPEDPSPLREGVAPHNEATKRDGIPPFARWTKISRDLVNPEALEVAKERFEERDDHVIVLRVLTREEILHLAESTRHIRELRELGSDPYYTLGRGNVSPTSGVRDKNRHFLGTGSHWNSAKLQGLRVDESDRSERH